MDEKPVLLIREGQLAGQRWTIDTEKFIIGRGSDCDIVLPERQVSRHHVTIVHEEGHYHLVDGGSKNGTHLNGNPCEGRVVLHDGDEIQIALCVKLMFIGTDATLPLNFEQPVVVGNLVLEEDARSVSIKGAELKPPLSLAQFRLLHALYKADGSVCDRDFIVGIVWPETNGLGVTEQAIDALVRRLRDRLFELDEHNYVVTVRGHGFRLDNPQN